MVEILPIHIYNTSNDGAEYYNPNLSKIIYSTSSDIEALLDIHDNIAILTAIWANVYLLLNNYELIDNIESEILDPLEKSIRQGKNPDFSYLLGVLLQTNTEKDLNGNEYYKKISESINLLNKQYNKLDYENKYNPIDIKFEYIKQEIIAHISSKLIGKDKISTTEKISNGYYINFNFFSYLGIDFQIKPIIITLIHDLVHNSVKYSNPGTQIDVVINQTKDWINVSISDEGFGIKQEDIEKIFEYGTRLDNVLNEKGSGKGGFKLALEIYKLGGKIYVKSEPGVGTEVLFRV